MASKQQMSSCLVPSLSFKLVGNVEKKEVQSNSQHAFQSKLQVLKGFQDAFERQKT